jgi:hypothetical protein
MKNKLFERDYEKFLQDCLAYAGQKQFAKPLLYRLELLKSRSFEEYKDSLLIIEKFLVKQNTLSNETEVSSILSCN